MATPSTRTPVRIARGSYSNLNSSLSDLQDGEIMYAEDQDKLYIKEGSSLVVLTQPAANAVFTGNVTVNAQGDLRLADSDSSNYVGFQSPATVSANVIWTLPDADSSGTQFLRSNGSGTLSWGSVDLSTYAPLASPTLTGTPAAPTASANTNTTQIATTAFVMTELGDYAPLAAPAFTGTATGVNLTLSGNLTVNGTTTTIDTTNLDVEDKNITIGKVSTPSDATADGGGLTLKGATDKTWNWVDSTDAWTSSEHIDLASGKVLKVAGSQVLSAAQYSGNAATATALATARTIGGTSFDGSANIAVALAGTATALATARTIGGVSFDGTANINLPGVNASGSQDTSGNAATATALATARTIAGVSFDGTANISLNNNAITNGAGYITSSGTAAGFSAGNASNLNAGTVAIARLGSSGTASATTFLRGDGAWAGAGVTSDANENTAAGTGSGNALPNTAYRDTFYGFNSGYATGTGDDNTFIGYEAGDDVVGGHKNTFVGGYCGENTDDGVNRMTAIGYQALMNADGDDNIGIGHEAGKAIGASTSYNIAIGDSCGSGLGDNSVRNIGIGKSNLSNTGTGLQDNIAIGYQNMASGSNCTGDRNLAMVYQAGYAITSGTDNIALGYRSGFDLTTGSHNICLGQNAVGNTTTGSANIGIGNETLGANAGSVLTGNDNVAVGSYAGRHIHTGATKNTLIGYYAGRDLTTGGMNVFIGASASFDAGDATTCNYSISIGEGSAVRNGSNNIAIGNNAQCESSSSNQITLGNTSINKLRVPGVSFEVTSSGVSDAKGNLRSVPTRNETSAYTLVAADAGKCINADNGVTVNTNVFSAGDVVTIINMATSNKTITQGSGLTMRNVGDDGNTGNVSVKKYAMCTLIFTSHDVCFFSTTAKA